jgi:hypothetical protein
LLLRWEGQVGNARLRYLLGLNSIRVSQWIRKSREFKPLWTQKNKIIHSHSIINRKFI